MPVCGHSRAAINLVSEFDGYLLSHQFGSENRTSFSLKPTMDAEISVCKSRLIHGDAEVFARTGDIRGVTCLIIT